MKLLSWGGVAILLNDEGKIEPVEGRAFCFLPLPIATSLPFHVNGSISYCWVKFLGYFVLSQDRRALWTTDSKTDTQALICWEWNQMILRTLVTPALIAVLCYYRDNFQKTFYDIFPYLQKTKIWEEVAFEFYRRLVNEKFFLIKKKWRLAQDIYFKEDVDEEVVEVLKKRFVEIAFVPPFIPKAINEIHKTQIAKFITPELVRSKLTFAPSLFEYGDLIMNSEELMKILQYATSDLSTAEDYLKLNKVALLPLEEEKYTTFDSSKQYFIL